MRRRIGWLIPGAYLLLVVALFLVLGPGADEGWRLALAFAGLPWTLLAAWLLDGVGLVSLPFVLAWETVFLVIGLLAVAINLWLLTRFGRKVTQRWNTPAG